MALVIRCVNSRWFGRWRSLRQRRHRRGATYCHSQHLNPSLLRKHPRGRPLRSNTRQSMQSEQPAASCPVENGRAGWLWARASCHECHHTQPEMAEGNVGTKLVGDEIRKSRQREPLCLHSMLCARFPRTRSFTLRSSPRCPLPFRTPVAATVTETAKPHHACSAERTDQVAYSGDQAHVGVSNYGKRSHNVSPCCGGSSPPNAQNLSAGPQARFGESALGIGAAAAPRFGFISESN